MQMLIICFRVSQYGVRKQWSRWHQLAGLSWLNAYEILIFLADLLCILPANYTTPKEKTSESKVLEQSSINNAAKFTLNMLKKENF